MDKSNKNIENTKTKFIKVVLYSSSTYFSILSNFS